MNGKLLIHVNILGGDEVISGNEKFCLVRFDGYADGGLFSGKILPGGVDCQHFTPDSGTLSARYILEGNDFTGAPCRIFIENNGDPFTGITSPVIRTDSAALKYLETAPLTGKMINGADGLIIEIS